MRQVLAQRIALDVFHGDEGVLRVFTVLVDCHDARVAERTRRLRLAPEAHRHGLGAGVILDQFLADGLDGHLALDDRVSGQVDDPHGAFAEHSGDGILAQEFRNVHRVAISFPASSWP